MDAACDEKLRQKDAEHNTSQTQALKNLAKRFTDATNRKVNEQKA